MTTLKIALKKNSFNTIKQILEIESLAARNINFNFKIAFILPGTLV